MTSKTSNKPVLKQNKFLIIIIFWVLVVGVVVVFNENIIRNGEEVFLKTRPVDPRDLFRGDYMILNYDISTLNADVASLPDGIATGDTIYLRLSKAQDGIATPIAVLRSEPSEGLYIKGKVSRVISPVEIMVEYGIESYFIPEGTGWDWPRITEARIVIGSDGNARITDVYNNMQRIDPKTLNTTQND